MDNKKLQQFIKEVMAINITYPGVGGAHTGVYGASSSNDQIVNDLRNSAAGFVKEYTNPKSEKSTLAELAKNLESLLYSAKLMGGISDKTLQKLTANLDSLINDSSTK